MSSLTLLGSDTDRTKRLRLNRRYRIGRKLGEGGMGQVYAAQDEQFALRDVAIKILHPSQNPIDAAEAKLLKEALTTGALNHQCIVKVHDVSRIEPDPDLPSALIGAYFMVMEYVSGETLFHQLQDRTPGRTTEEWFQLFLELTRAVKFAHEKEVIHRDLKPGNIIVTEHGSAAKHGIKVLDFGIAQVGERVQDGFCPRKVPSLCSPCGTSGYMPPEAVIAFETSQPIAAKKSHDVYALGVILYQMLSQAIVWPVPSPGVYRPLCQDQDSREQRFASQRYDRLIISALGLEPTVRFSDATELEAACCKLLVEKQEWERQESDRNTRNQVEGQAYLHAQRERQQLELQHQTAIQRRRKAWIAATSVVSAVMFWGGIHFTRVRTDRQVLAELNQDCQRRLQSAENVASDHPSVLPLLDRLLRRGRTGADLPLSCVRWTARHRLAQAGLLTVEPKDVLAKELRIAELALDTRKALGLSPYDDYGMAVAPESGQVLLGGREGKFLIAKVRDGRLIKESVRTSVLSADHRGYPIIPMAISPHGDHAIVAYQDGGAARLFAPSSNNLQGDRLEDVTLLKPSNAVRISGVSVSDGGMEGLLATQDNRIFRWSIRADSPQVEFAPLVTNTPAPVKHLSMIAAGAGHEPMVLAATDHDLYLWSPHTDKPLARVRLSVHRLILHRDGTIAVLMKTEQRSGSMQVFRVDPERLLLAAKVQSSCSIEALLSMSAAQGPEFTAEPTSGRLQAILHWVQTSVGRPLSALEAASQGADFTETQKVNEPVLSCL